MAIVRKPALVSERAVEAVISKGGNVASAVPARPVPITRDAWILEALHEKGTREFG